MGELIKWLEALVDFYDYPASARFVEKEERDRNEGHKKNIINLLQRGNKYKKIVEEMDQVLEPEPGMMFEIPEGILGSRHIDVVKYLFNQIKEKYFPEPVKKYITIEVESEKESEVDAGMEDIKELVDNMGCPKMKIANEWKEE